MRNLRFAVRVAFYGVTIYSALSTVLIYVFLQRFSFFLSDSLVDTDVPSNISASAACGNSATPFNVLSRDVISKSEVAVRGWWQDHATFKTEVQCFNRPWALCSTCFSVACKPVTVRAIYQHLSFRRNATLRSFRLSLRSSAEQLESQTTDSFFGAIALVKLSDGSEEFLKVPFPATTSTLVQRDGVYTVSRVDRIITTVTVMLSCYGYAGMVHFTDVVLTPLRERGVLDCHAKDVVEDCPSPPRSALGHKRLKLRHELIFGKVKPTTKKQHLNKDVALITQLSMDRLPVLEHTLQQWEGPVSLVIYAPVKRGQPDGDWQRLYVQKKLQNLKLHPDSHVTLAYGVAGDYPINALRNIAIRQTNCEYLLLADADFQPSPEFHKHFLLSTR